MVRPDDWTWRVEDETHSDPDNACGTVVVDCGGMGEFACTNVVELMDLTKKNAALMTAAPLLRQALRQLILVPEFSGEEASDEAIKALEAARKAITKADR